MSDLNALTLFDIPDEIFFGYIVAFLPSRRDGSALAATSKAFHQWMISTRNTYCWDQLSTFPIKVCIDSHCPTCFLSSTRPTKLSAFRFLQSFPIKRIRVHCFVTDVPACLECLSSQQLLTDVELTLTNTSTSLPLDILLTRDSHQQVCIANGFPNLCTLILRSSHLNHVRLAGRSQLLNLIGRNLTTLKFEVLSPSGMFSILENRCPYLKSIRVDKALTMPDFQEYRNANLEELELYRCNFIPKTLQFERLKIFKFSAMFRLEENEIRLLLHSITNLTVLWLEIPGKLVNFTLATIGKYGLSLTELTLNGSGEGGQILGSSLMILGSRCTSLRRLDLTATNASNPLTFDSTETFAMVRTQFPNLQHVRIVLSSIVLSSIRAFTLLNVESSLQLVIQANRRLYGDRWLSLMDYLRRVCVGSMNTHLVVECC